MELAKEAKELWKKGSMTERLEILKRVCWNPILDGVNLRYGLRKPFATIAEMSEKQDWRTECERLMWWHLHMELTKVTSSLGGALFSYLIFFIRSSNA